MKKSISGLIAALIGASAATALAATPDQLKSATQLIERHHYESAAAALRAGGGEPKVAAPCTGPRSRRATAICNSSLPKAARSAAGTPRSTTGNT